MLAIAAMCKQKGWEFIYYTKPLSLVQKEQGIGNYSQAISLGMKHIEIDRVLYKDFIASLRVTLESRCYLIDQGGASRDAKEGIVHLAKEIREAHLDIDAIATPSGTGTTALYLALALPEYKVYTTAAIGDSEYLQEQMRALSEIPKNLFILQSKRKYHFAKLYPEFLEIYHKTKKSGVEFDLLYAPAMWLNLLEHSRERVLYIHSGGVSGNVSMLKRYELKEKNRRASSASVVKKVSL